MYTYIARKLLPGITRVCIGHCLQGECEKAKGEIQVECEKGKGETDPVNKVNPLTSVSDEVVSQPRIHKQRPVPSTSIHVHIEG